jgi:hypothetical protein
MPRRAAWSRIGPRPARSRAQTVSASAASRATPDQSETHAAPNSAAMSIAPQVKATRRSRPSRVADTSVGSCFSRGSSRCRAPVSTTLAMPAAASAVRQRSIRVARSGDSGCSVWWSSVIASDR